MLPLILAFGLNLLIIPLVRKFSFRVGRVAQPRQDRWHSQPTPTLGGIGIFLAFGLALLFSAVINTYSGARTAFADPVGEPIAYSWLPSWLMGWTSWSFLAGSVLMFGIGLWDEFRPLQPSAKLVGQVIAATLVISLGYTSTFFSPRIDNPLAAQIPNILLTYVWLIGITNAINLLDNMDGLAGGIALITAAVLGYFFWRGHDETLLWAALALVGSLAGFLVYNFPPARIFMGDSGSLFIGFTLAVLAIAHQKQQASNVLAALGVPTLLFLLPILDTGLVTFTRLLRGQSPVQGGRDHTSHRLIAFGLSERQTLFVLYSVALAAAVTAAVVESLSYWLSLALAPLILIGFTLLAAYLGGVKVITAQNPDRRRQAIARWLGELTYRRRVLEVGLDFGLISLAYYLAFLGRYGLVMNDELLSLYRQTLPLTLVGSFLAFFLSGVYRGIWRYADFGDLLRFVQAALWSVALTAGLIFIFGSSELAPWQGGFPRLVLALYAVFILLGLAGTRLSFRVFDRLAGRRSRPEDLPVIIYGAGDAGELALHWILSSPQMNYRPIGFLDDNPLRAGRLIHGIEVLGGGEKLAELLQRKMIAGVILADSTYQAQTVAEIAAMCRASGCWIRSLRIEFEPFENQDT